MSSRSPQKTKTKESKSKNKNKQSGAACKKKQRLDKSLTMTNKLTPNPKEKLIERRKPSIWASSSSNLFLM